MPTVERKPVIPGDVIATGDHRFGSYIEKRGDSYIALRVGLAENGRDGLRLNPLSGPYLPRAEDEVIGKVVAIDLPVYDFKTHTRTSDTIRTEPKPVIMVEGILIFIEPGLRELLDIKIFVDTDADIRFIRRLQRDIEERGRTSESVIRQYLETVRPMHLEFVEPSKRYADVIIPEGGMNTVALDMLVARIDSLLFNRERSTPDLHPVR